MKYRSKKFVVTVLVTIVAFGVLLALFSPFFIIQDVVIQGTHRTHQSAVLEHLNIGHYTNILLFNTAAARERIMSDLYIGHVEFRRDLPGTLYVTIFERRLSAYVEHMPGSFLFLDDDGRVLEVRPYISESFPLLEGLNFSRFQLGEILEVENMTDFTAVVHYTQLLSNYGLIHNISHINVADPDNIRILVNYLEFHVGDTRDADEKVRTIAEILNELPDAGRIRGFVNIQEIRPEFFLELLQ